MPYIKEFKLRHNKQSAGSQYSSATFNEKLVVGYTARQVPNVNDI